MLVWWVEVVVGELLAILISLISLSTFTRSVVVYEGNSRVSSGILGVSGARVRCGG